MGLRDDTGTGLEVFEMDSVLAAGVSVDVCLSESA